MGAHVRARARVCVRVRPCVPVSAHESVYTNKCGHVDMCRCMRARAHVSVLDAHVRVCARVRMGPHGCAGVPVCTCISMHWRGCTSVPIRARAPNKRMAMLG